MIECGRRMIISQRRDASGNFVYDQTPRYCVQPRGHTTGCSAVRAADRDADRVWDVAGQVIAWRKRVAETRSKVRPSSSRWDAGELDPTEEALERDIADYHRWCVDAAPVLADFVAKVDEATRGNDELRRTLGLPILVSEKEKES